VTVLTAYMPHSRRPEQERVGAMEVFGKMVDRWQKKGVVLAMGTFNARIHARLRGESPVLAPTSTGGVWGGGGRR